MYKLKDNAGILQNNITYQTFLIQKLTNLSRYTRSKKNNNYIYYGYTYLIVSINVLNSLCLSHTLFFSNNELFADASINNLLAIFLQYFKSPILKKIVKKKLNTILSLNISFKINIKKFNSILLLVEKLETNQILFTYTKLM